MLTPSRAGAPGSVIGAAVVAIICSALTVLLFGLTLLSFALVGSQATAQMPPSIKTFTEVALAICLIVSIFGVVTGAGLLRLQNWARISALVWAGVSAFFSFFGILIMSVMPFPTTPGASPEFLAGLRWGMALVYSLPLCIGIWWLILFNRAAIRLQFANPHDASGDSGVSPRPRCPLPVAILAWIFIVSALSSIPLMYFMPFPIPVILFGHTVPGVAGKFFLGLNCALIPIAGVALLKLKPWSYPLTIVLNVFWFASGIVTLFSPNYKTTMKTFMTQMHDSAHFANAGPQPPEFLPSTSWSAVFVLAFYGLALGILLYYRKPFLETAKTSQAA